MRVKVYVKNLDYIKKLSEFGEVNFVDELVYAVYLRLDDTTKVNALENLEFVLSIEVLHYVSNSLNVKG